MKFFCTRNDRQRLWVEWVHQDPTGEARHHDPGTEWFGQDDVHPDADEGADPVRQSAP